MRLFDTHAHLCAPDFADDLDVVIERARAAGVESLVAVGENLEDAARNLDLADRFPDFILPAAGLFPTILDEAAGEELETFIREHRQRWIAIGEVGLDFWKVKDAANRVLQRRIFGRFVDLALDLNLPLNVHSRSAGHHTIDFLIERGARRVQMHAFDGKASRAQRGVDAGFFFSVPPSVVRSKQKQKLVQRLPLSALLLETDSPVLGRDAASRNEPACLVQSLSAIASLKGEREETVAAAIFDNTRRLYGPRLAPPRGTDGTNVA